MIICFLIGILIIPLVRKFAFYINAVDEPRERHIHTKITPTLGGLAIFVAFTIGMLLLAVDKSGFLPVYIGAVIIVVTGFVDDILELSPRWKLVGQISAALCVVLWGQITIEFINIPFVGPLYFGVWAIPITLIWIVAIVNALNLIDGLDGLAGGVSIIALLTIAGMALLLQDVFVAPVAFMLIACILAFLVYNFPPATIFMGDTGSLFLGYMIAVLSLMGFKNVTFISILVPLIILGVPLSDTFFCDYTKAKGKNSDFDGRQISYPSSAYGVRFFAETNRVADLLYGYFIFDNRFCILIFDHMGSCYSINIVGILYRNHR